MKPWQHFRTITHHRHLVMLECFRVGLVWQGLTHDLSKYSPTEFLVGAKYYLGNRSPNWAERNEKGYSSAWLHHKGRNRHHFEYWFDVIPGTSTYVPLPMPRKYLVEMLLDRIAACKTYNGKNYHDGAPLEYHLRAKEDVNLHPQTKKELEFLLEYLRDHGEKETFLLIRKKVLPGKNFLPDPSSNE